MSTFFGRILPILALTLLSILPTNQVIGQTLGFTSTSSDLVVCGLPDTFTIDMSNQTADTVFNLDIRLDLYSGLNYVNNSASGGGVSQVSVPAVDSVLLSKDTLLPFQTASFQFLAFASCSATDSGLVFNNIHVAHNLGADSSNTAPFLILRPALSIQSVIPASVTDTVGTTFTRCITLINGGFGEMRDFLVAIEADTSLLSFSNFRLVPSNTPVPVTVLTDSIIMKLDFPLISQVGDGDGLFEQNETMEICYDVTIRTCDGGQSAIHAYWGCQLDVCESQTQTANAIVDDITPVLSVSRIFQTNTCYGDSTSVGKIIVTNTGAGPARDVSVDVWVGNSNAPTSAYIMAIDTSTMLWKNANGNVISVSPAYVENGSSAGNRICLGPNPIRRARVVIPFMDPGEQDTLVFELIDCCKTWCGYTDYVTGRSHYEVKYQSICDTTTYYVGPNLLKSWNFARSLSLAVTGPTDINPGDTAMYCIEHSDFRFYDFAGGAYSIADIVLPPSLNYTGLAGDFFYEDPQGDLWNPVSVTVIGDTIRGIFNLPQPAGVTREKINLKFRVVPNCSSPCDGGQTQIQYFLHQVPDTTCACVANVICYNFDVNVHCGICNCTDGGLIFTDFLAQRANYGLPDNDDNGVADLVGALDSTQVRMNYVMFGDTLRTRFSGRVDTTTANPFWTHGYAASTITRGQRLTPIGASIQIFDLSAATTYSCPLPAPTVNVVAGETREYIYEFDTASLAACLPVGFVFDEGDSIDVNARYQVTSNVNGIIQSQSITNEFALLNPTTTGDTASCDNYSGAFVLVGYYYTNCCYGKYNATACNQVTISQNYYLSVGNCCANYGGGNIFDHEFRHWGIMDKAYVVVPSGYNFVSAQHRHWATTGTGSTTSYTNPIPLGGTSGDTLIFDLDSMFVPYGGPVPIGDDGWTGQLQVTLEPTCEVEQDAERVWYVYDAEPIPALTGPGSYPVRRTSYDSLAYQAANLVLAPSVPVVPGIEGTVQWDFLIENLANVHDAENTWFAFFSPSGQIVPLTVTDLATNTVINPVNGIYQIGTLPGDSIQGYSVTASYNTCDYDSLQVITGWNCPSYPSSLASAACVASTAYLYVDPQPADLQATLTMAPGPFDICDSILVELNVVSSQIGYVRDIVINTIVPLSGGLTFQPGSGEMLYPSTGSFSPIPDPTLSGNVLTWDVNAISAAIAANDLPGTTRPDSNSFTIRFYLETDCDFISGRQFLINLESDRTCGDPLSPILLISPPIDINGATQPYTTIVAGTSVENTSCPMNQTLEVAIVKSGGGTTNPGDSILVELNPGYNYAGNFVGVSNSPSVTNPNQTPQAGGTILTWELPAGLNPGDSVIFRFDVDISAQVGCGNDFATVSTVVNSNLFCARTATNCVTSSVTGTALLTIPINRPDLTFTAFTSTRAQVTGGWEYNYNGTIQNNGVGITGGTTTTVQFYCDTDNSGGFSANDSLLGNYTTTAAIPNGGTHNLSGFLFYNNSACADSSDIFAVIVPDTANGYCLCDTAVANTNVVLPVAWLSLDGEAQAEGNLLNWEAVLLPGHDHFEVQRMESGLWKSISPEIRGGGMEFEWMHRFPEQVEEYRIMATDQNGGRSHSEVLRLERGEGQLFAVHPNPARHEVFLNGPRGAYFTISNMMGVMVDEGYLGQEELRLDVSSLPAGVYFVGFEMNGQGQVIKLVLE